MRIVLFFVAALLFGSVFAKPAPKLNEKALRLGFESLLKDADSAKFRDIEYKASENAGSWTMCGEVSAKNSYGAYNGYEAFLAMAIKEKNTPIKYLVFGIGEASAKVCTDRGLRR